MIISLYLNYINYNQQFIFIFQKVSNLTYKFKLLVSDYQNNGTKHFIVFLVILIAIIIAGILFKRYLSKKKKERESKIADSDEYFSVN